MVDPKVSAKRLAEVIGEAQGVSMRSKHLLDELKARSAKLEAAIRVKHLESVELPSGEIEASVTREDQELSNIAHILRHPLGEVRRDETLALTKAAQIEKLVDFPSDLQTQFTDRFEEAQKLEAGVV